MPETGEAAERTNGVEQQYPVLEPSGVVYRFPEDLASLNEVNVYVHIFDFTEGQEKNVWGNKALCSLMGVNLEVLQSINLTDCSETLRKWQKSLLQNIQIDKRTETSMKTISPGGKPISLFYTFRPMELLFPGAKEPRTVVFSTSVPVKNDSREDEELILCQEMTRYTHVAQMVVSKPSSKIVYSNQSARLLWPDLTDQTKEVTVQDLLNGRVWASDEEKQQVLENFNNLTIKSQPFEVECKVQDKLNKGHHTWHRMTFTPCLHPITGADAVTVNEFDTTKLHLQAEMLEESRAREEEFLAAVSHELRTPLNGIIGLSESLQQNPKCDQQMIKTLQLIKTCGKRLSALVNDILDSASSRRGTFALREESVSLREVCENVCETLAPLCGASVTLVNEVDKDRTLPHVEGDGSRITQIVTNFISNSIKFTERGSITVTSRRVGEGEILVEIKDTGCGVPKEKLQRIWEPFKQVDMSTTRKYGGTGLGLSLVKQLVEAHGGRVGVTSKHGVEKTGSTFYFVLPIKRTAERHEVPEEEAAAAAAAEAEERRQAREVEPGMAQREESGGMRRVGSRDRLENLRPQGAEEGGSVAREGSPAKDVPHHSQLYGEFEILSVDDNMLNHVVVENSLSPKGYKVTKCMSGGEALRLLSTRGYLPDLILLDCMMPEMDGTEMCRQLRQQYPCSTLPVIMVSAKNKEDDIVKGLKAGCNDFISKPYGSQELNARIDVQFKVRYLWNLEIQRLLSDREAVLHLPPEVEERVRGGELAVHRNVLVAVVDIQDLLAYVRSLRARDLAGFVNELYDSFDEVAKREQLTRIIDDTYMIVMQSDSDSAAQTPSASAELQRLKRMVEVTEEILSRAERVRVRISSREAKEQRPRVRIGIARGVAHSALVGMKFATYSYFGPVVRDAMQLASRGHAGCIVTNEELRWMQGADDNVEWVQYGGNLAASPLGAVRGGPSPLNAGYSAGDGGGAPEHVYLAKLGRFEDALAGEGPGAWEEPEGGGVGNDSRHLRTLVRLLSAAGHGERRVGMDQVSMCSSEELGECPRCEEHRERLETVEAEWQREREVLEHELGKVRGELKRLRGETLVSEIARSQSSAGVGNIHGSFRAPSAWPVPERVQDRQAVIMSVDDDPVNQMVVENLLDPVGYKVVCCMNGMEALEHLQNAPVLPDLILLDNMMPVMNGLECCGKIREKYPRTVLPIIMVSAKSGVDSIVEGLEQGCNDYVSKPFDRIELLARISTQLRARDAHFAELDHNRSTQLLARLLPEHALAQLRSNMQLSSMVLAEYPVACAMAVSVVDYAGLSEAAVPREVVGALGALGERLQALAGRHGCTMVEAGGQPWVVVAWHEEEESAVEQALSLVGWALDALDAVRGVEDPRGGRGHLELQAAMHCGAACEGLVGVQYGVYGAAVGRALALQAKAPPMSVLVSQETVELLKTRPGAVMTRVVEGGGASVVADDRSAWGEALQALQAEPGGAGSGRQEQGGGKKGNAASEVEVARLSDENEQLQQDLEEAVRAKKWAVEELAAAQNKLHAAHAQLRALEAAAAATAAVAPAAAAPPRRTSTTVLRSPPVLRSPREQAERIGGGSSAEALRGAAAGVGREEGRGCGRCRELEARLQDCELALESSRSENNKLIGTCDRLSGALSSTVSRVLSIPEAGAGSADAQHQPFPPADEAYSMYGRPGDAMSGTLAEVMLAQARKEMFTAQAQCAMLSLIPPMQGSPNPPDPRARVGVMGGALHPAARSPPYPYADSHWRSPDTAPQAPHRGRMYTPQMRHRTDIDITQGQHEHGYRDTAASPGSFLPTPEDAGARYERSTAGLTNFTSNQ